LQGAYTEITGLSRFRFPKYPFLRREDPKVPLLGQFKRKLNENCQVFPGKHGSQATHTKATNWGNMDKGLAVGDLVRVLDNMPTSSFRGAVLQVRGFHRGAVIGVIVQHSPATFGVKWLCGPSSWPK